MRFNKKTIILYIVILILLFIASNNNWLDLNIIKQNEFNFITINTVFAGFLFTSLGIMAGFTSNNALNKFERIKTMDSIYLNILLGISFSVISIIISICKIIFTFNITINWINNIVSIIEIYFMILTIVQFVISVKCTYFAITVVRSDVKKNLPSKESIQETLKKIK
ncbi:hypothetical protein QTH53_01930 [Clostridium perfringens]|uniref:hypothetical protein n=1 Tax=Clostridium perfringens TaxID=1502 RepID=UPI00224589A0|nr:hypothetical protein [Clostridium perfringens]MCX0397429.1 hypothetical protein [Clostridium perfringens]MDM0625068.1 hypothetical protein [Clostridium perfringens]MDM0673074.1 hypothetical protein [Clostridium perfringens]